MGEGSGTKRVNMLFNKVLGENEKRVSYFYLKTKGTFWSTQYNKMHENQIYILCTGTA